MMTIKLGGGYTAYIRSSLSNCVMKCTYRTNCLPNEAEPRGAGSLWCPSVTVAFIRAKRPSQQEEGEREGHFDCSFGRLDERWLSSEV